MTTMDQNPENPRLKASAEKQRLQSVRNGFPWKKWGPYLSERQWGTVREDYSDNGDAWNYFTHDQARSRAYRWGEDGLGGISDDHQVLCFALALWNGNDPILKERLFGLTNSEGNHGEDVKEYYFYLDSTPTHSYMKYLYKYPQAEYPYEDLIKTNQQRSKDELEYELLDTGIFDENRYFDVFVEYAKDNTEDILIKISVANRGPEAADIHLLPTLWFRNTWSWADGGAKPIIQKVGDRVIQTHHTDPLFQKLVSDYYLYCDRTVPLLFTDNETNNAHLFGVPNPSYYVKDGINNYVVHGQREGVNPAQTGTKCSPHYHLTVGAGATEVICLRLTKTAPREIGEPFATFETTFQARLQEADAFYDSVTPPAIKADSDRVNVMRQALAGMLWTKQYFYYDVDKWLEEHNINPLLGPEQRSKIRNGEWFHMHSDDIISMPDKWEYPWFAAWDLAFHMLPLSSIDSDFAKEQLDLMLRNDYLHPNGQIPAYEWNFGDVNPPVHAYATMQIYLMDKARNFGQGDLDFLKYAFSKLLVNFTWWVNRKDSDGNNAFEGGFLGLDNIGVFDRSAPLPTGGSLEQADGTAWMVFFSQQMLRIAVELAVHDPLYEEFVSKFFEHTMWIAGAMDRIGENQDEMWDEEDGFFYDVLKLPDGTAMRLKVRSLVGLLPLAAVAIFNEDDIAKLPNFYKRAQAFWSRHFDLIENIHIPDEKGAAGRYMLSVFTEEKLRKVLSRMLDENEFFSPYGIRSLSRYHADNPFIFHHAGEEFRVDYVPGDSNTGMFGGNSNWRGPVWMPVNMLFVASLRRLYSFYGDDFKVECPTGSGQYMTLFEVARELAERLISLFLKDSNGKRPINGASDKFQNDPYWKDLILFYEYFHGDSGAGIGASHQTGWTGGIATIIQVTGILTDEVAEELLSSSDVELEAMRKYLNKK
ncbi:MGH1-like glycoside hydrolase domain-containing protein [Crocosphaera sp. XPORK-15E]|uniref:MGH1-like glycoside hydrolase domain-containing protein n=1 Tax=Crocosphaera sp. XPORK-15E TaxID=3110247 RepID=UPI002B21CF3A|nr:glucosidase [Crocosphaera sp. XPORK-15E]MEA5536340.1 glucosidase [Crocosphaera sp. XPORK-15E]